MAWNTQSPVLAHDHVRLTPIIEDDRAPLLAVALDPDIWRHFVIRVESEADFDQFFDAALADQAAGRRRVFIVTDLRTGRVAGSMSYANLSEADSRLEIGFSWLGRDFRGAGVNRWAKYLLLEHAFERMGALRVEFKTDVLNDQARRGLRNIGAVEEGVLRSYNPMPSGRRRDAIYYSVLAEEWPAVKKTLAEHPKVGG